MKKHKRVGILTAGGDCPGLNAAVRVVVKAAIGEYGYEVWGIPDGYAGLIAGKCFPLNWDMVSGILDRGGTILGTSNKANPFRQPIKQGDKIIYRDFSREVLKHYQRWKLDALICIGGDGTLKIAYQLGQIGLNIVGLPKTIDNDLNATEYTFGFDSAVETATAAIDRLHTTAQSHHRVMVIELMGRYAGWLALFAGIAGGGDIILIPELPFRLEAICSAVNARNKHGKRFSIVVVAEGAHLVGGGMVVKRQVADSPDPVRLGGIGEYLVAEIEKQTGIESRLTILGHLQRGGSPTAFDRLLATQFGYQALELIARGKFGKMVSWQKGKATTVNLINAVGKLKLVPPNHLLIRVGRSLGTCFG